MFKFYWNRKARYKVSKFLDGGLIWSIEIDEGVIGDYFLITSCYYGKLEKFIKKLESMVKKSNEVQPC